MATTIPPALRAADIARFALRAGQLEKARPVIAYWCNYWIVNQILAKSLHTSDDESMTYTMRLVDKLEQTKVDHAEDDAVKHDLPAQAYVEQFGFETFQRAENAMKLNKASRQTADTFQAAATFLELCQIWGPLEPEIASKIKFAKYHAVRIVRAIKAGEDPNLSNPTPEVSPVRELPPTESDPRDIPSVNDLEKPGFPSHQPSVEDAVDGHEELDPLVTQRPEIDQSLHTPRSPFKSQITNQDFRSRSEGPSPPMAEDYYSNSTTYEVSPLRAAPYDPNTAEEGGYFPNIPNTENIESTSNFAPMSPTDQSLPPSTQPPYSSPIPYSQAPEPHPPSSLHSFPPPPPNQTEQPHPQPHNPSIPPPSYPYPTQSFHPPSHPPPHQQHLQHQPPPHPNKQFAYPPPPPPSLPSTIPTQTQTTSYVADEEAIAKAQKHARFAISALNFEDVKTAVLELRGALEALGAGG